jgi:hypothetical protein
MTSIVIIEKSGEIKEKSVKNLVEGDLYKSAGFKSAADFKCHTVWNLELDSTAYSVELYGKTSGRAGQENKYEFPPPMDNTLFFGNCVAVRRDKPGGQIIGLKAAEWEVIYESLYGGFEDIEMSDSEDDDDDEYDSDDELPKTKTGYAKDDFVVDDDDDEEDDDDDEDHDDDDDDEDDDMDEEDDDDGIVSKPSAAKKRTGGAQKTANISAAKSKSKRGASVATATTTTTTAAAIEIAALSPPTAEQNYLDCTTELTEEEYDA